jgi:phosphinothricin acetyltransferase
MEIRDATTEDAGAIAAIYNPYVTDTLVTFETDPLPVEQMRARIEGAQAANLPWLVGTEGHAVVGYTHASPWKGRWAYRYSVESTVYLEPSRTRRGMGSRLYGALVDRLRERGFHAVIGGIALPNAASIALHERLGFGKVAHFPQVGFKHERWIDVGYWQLLLNS